MFKLKRGYFYAAILLIISIGCIISSCGGGSNNGTLPVTNTNSNIDSNPSAVTSTPTPVLTNINLSGYIYGNNITTDEGETVPNIILLDVPASKADSSGNEPFTTQVLNALKSDYPEDWTRPEVQELYAQLDKTLSESKPLPEYNAQAQVSSVYSDTTIPVGSDGHFDNTVLTGAADSTVKLGVTLGEDSYTEVETLPSSANITNINSSDATGAVLKSCPEKICAFPGEILIFKVYSEPGINLKSAGLKFTLNNTSIGCITQPVYLCLFGAHKYQVAYCCVYIKPGLDTPVDTTITAKLNSGQSINIFLEVIKKAASISGTVYTGGMPLVKGFVYSIGPRAYCKLDSNGQYTLPKVFRGHERAVVAVWQTSENGQKIWHREAKIIDFFNSDLTGFNFGVPPTPTPTATVTFISRPAIFYSQQTLNIMPQFFIWKEELGTVEAAQKTVDWLNKKVSGHPIPDCIVGAEMAYDSGTSPSIYVYFDDGESYSFYTGYEYSGSFVNNNKTIRNDITNQRNKFNEKHSLQSSNTPICFKPDKILILSPFEWQLNSPIATDSIVNELKDIGFTNYVSKIIHSSDLNCFYTWPSYPMETGGRQVNVNNYLFTYNNPDNFITPRDYEKLGDYGLVYVLAHSSMLSIYGGIALYDPNTINTRYPDYCEDIRELRKTKQYNPKDNPKGLWKLELWPITEEDLGKLNVEPLNNGQNHAIEVICLLRGFFRNQNDNQTSENSVIYINGCHSAMLNETLPETFDNDNFKSDPPAFPRAQLFLGNNNFMEARWGKCMAYYLFHYMMYGNIIPEQVPGFGNISGPTPEFNPNKSMHVKEAINALNSYMVNPNPLTYTYEGISYKTLLTVSPANSTDEIYFPGNASVTVHKNEKNIK